MLLNPNGFLMFMIFVFLIFISRHSIYFMDGVFNEAHFSGSFFQRIRMKNMHLGSRGVLERLHQTIITKAKSILIPLSRQPMVGNFCFNLYTPTFAIFYILLHQSKLRQINCHTFLPRILWKTFILIPPISSSITTSIRESVSQRMTWPYQRQ